MQSAAEEQTRVEACAVIRSLRRPITLMIVVVGRVSVCLSVTRRRSSLFLVANCMCPPRLAVVFSFHDTPPPSSLTVRDARHSMLWIV